MSEPYIGEIRIFAGNFAPRGWAFCNGQLVSIAQNNALFALLGTVYGGDGVSTFGLPNLQGRSPVHFGQGPGLSPYTLGQTGGVEEVTLTTNQIPTHNHLLAGGTTGTQASPAGGLHGTTPARDYRYSSQVAGATLNAAVVQSTGSNLPHENLAPYLAMSFIIATEGVFPSRN